MQQYLILAHLVHVFFTPILHLLPILAIFSLSVTYLPFLEFSRRIFFRFFLTPTQILPPPPGWGEISANVIWGKNMKRRREKEGKYKRKRKKGERK
jgi:hypothetical protein